jgi:hypothetical protein
VRQQGRSNESPGGCHPLRPEFDRRFDLGSLADEASGVYKRLDAVLPRTTTR